MSLTLPSSGATSLSNEAIWESSFEAIPGISRIQEGDLNRLSKLLFECDDPDSYLTSAIYYSFTGRHGLWVYEKGDAFVLACRHPNVPGQILIFPQLKSPDIDLVGNLLGEIPVPPKGVRLVRAKASMVPEGSELHFSARHISLMKTEENVLDWKFPVRILNTADVAATSGHKYMKVRNHLRALHKHNVQVLPFDPIHHSRALERLLHRWANHNANSREEYENLYAPYDTLFSQSMDKPAGLSGQMIFVDGELQSVGLWDVSNKLQKTANVYVNFCNTDIRGLSEFSVVKCCEALRDQGIVHVNLGGSETESLDAYKRKFDLASSIDLCSIDAVIKDDFIHTPKRTVDPSMRHQVIFGKTANV